MAKQENPYPLRLEQSLAKKLKQLAKENSRSYNKEIEFILKNYLAAYEREHGEIVVEEE